MKTKLQAVPASLVNSTIALFPVTIAILVYEKSIRDTLSMGGVSLLFFLILNILLCFNWTRIGHSYIKNILLYTLVPAQWFVVAQLTTKLEPMQNIPAVQWNPIFVPLSISLFALLAIAMGAKKIGSSPVFAVLGLLAISTWGWSAVSDQPLKGAEPNLAISDQKPGSLPSESSEVTIASIKSGDANPLQWGYDSENGPLTWSKIQPEFAACELGKFQSPLDVPKRTAFSSETIAYVFKEDRAKLSSDASQFSLKLSGESKVTFNGSKFVFREINFHTPSEHTVSGFKYPMEIQLMSTDSLGHSLAISVFVKKGSENLEFTKVLKVSDQKANGIDQDLAIDAGKFLVKTSEFWKYRGSATVPPCKEGVTWFIMNEQVEFSNKQIAAFRAMYPMNARPVQPANDRSFEGSKLKPLLAH